MLMANERKKDWVFLGIGVRIYKMEVLDFIGIGLKFRAPYLSGNLRYRKMSLNDLIFWRNLAILS